jgi:amino acid transporter
MVETTAAAVASGAPPTASAVQAGHRLRQGALSLPDALAQSVTVMAPALSGGLITYLAAIKAGGATPLAFVIATLACLLIGAVVSEFARSIRSAGSLYTYTVHGLGPFVGFVMGWGYLIGIFLAGPAVLAGASVFLSMVMADIGAPTVATFWWLWFGAGLLGWFALAYPGVRLSTRSSLVFTAAGMVVLLTLAFTVIFHGGAHGNGLSAFNPHAAGVGWPGIFGGVAFGILSFTGFETAANLAEETREPRRNIPLAVLGSVAIGGIFYVAVTYATSVGYGVREATTEWPKSASGLAPLADTYASYLKDLVLLAVAFSAFFCGLGVSNAVTRTLFAMGRDGVLPKALSRTHPKHQTPHIALLTYLAVSAVFAVALIAMTSPATRDGIAGGGGRYASGLYLFVEGLTIITPPIMLAYAFVSTAGIAYGLRHRRPALVVASIGALVGAGIAVFGSLYYSFVPTAPGGTIPTPYRAIPWAILAWLTIGGLIAGWLRRTRRETWERMGTIFE